MGQIRVCIASTLIAHCAELHHLLDQQDDLDVLVVGGKRLPSLLAQIRPDILLLDEALNDEPQQVCKSLHSSSPATRILIFNGANLDGAALLRTLSFGVRGGLLRGCAQHQYVKAIRTVHAGGLWLERQALETFLLRGGAEFEAAGQPTPRESEIIECVRRGMTNKEVARCLGISDKTVKIHLNHIYSKLGVSRRMHLVLPQSVIAADAEPARD